jgi:predicted anti-sigma-YlaC factor YlaD
MRCRDAKFWLTVQRDDDPVQSEVSTVQEHLQRCGGCRSFEQNQQRLDILLPHGRESLERAGISTERIMLAIQQHKRITQQLEDIRTKQQSRIARLHRVGPSMAVVCFALAALPLLVFAVEPQLIVKVFTLLSGGIEAFFMIAQYVEAELLLITHNSLLLSGVALALVMMMGLWLRLMRYPQEA